MYCLYYLHVIYYIYLHYVCMYVCTYGVLIVYVLLGFCNGSRRGL